MLFNQVIGQTPVKKRLLQSVNDQRISHAQLFVGPEGSGNLALAVAYAQYVLCTARTGEDSCGQCPSCRKAAKFMHPDLHFVFPVIKTQKIKDPVSDSYLAEWRNLVPGNPYLNLNDWFEAIDVENAQGLIYSHESEEIIRKLNLKSFESEYKVMIIWMPEKMHVSCANKLLKMIEEPPAKTLFLLVSENEEDIISTIRSRCQLIRIPTINPADMLSALSSLPEATDRDAANLIHLARGNFRVLRELLNPDESTLFNLERFKELMRFSFGRKYLDAMTWAETMAGIGREKQKSFLSYALGQIRENFIFNLKQQELVYMNEHEQDFSSRCLRRSGTGRRTRCPGK